MTVSLAAAVPACVGCGEEATRTVGGRPLCDSDSCLSRTQGTRDKVQGTRNGSSEGVNRGLYVVGSPCVREPPKTEENFSPVSQEPVRREPELRGLIRDHADGRLEPVDVRLGELPADASPAMHAVATDIRLLLGLRLAVAEDRPLPYSTRFCAERGGLYDQAHASRVLRQLERAGVVKCAEPLEPSGQPFGTKTYAAP